MDWVGQDNISGADHVWRIAREVAADVRWRPFVLTVMPSCLLVCCHSLRHVARYVMMR